jgi:drug/metabolite transporter (DMT)-like permease
VVLFGSIAVILYPLLFEYGLRVTNTTELSVLALIAAVVILINGRRATLRRGLGIGCALVGLLILWIGWSYYLSDPTYFFRVLQYRPDILVNLASEIAIVIGGVLTAATAKTSAADVKPVPFPRP